MTATPEHQRLSEPSTGPVSPWRRWGTYVSERAWGTVREDYSANGDAWTFLPHDLARSKAYRWGEDGLAGWCDRYQILVFSLALWNGRDPILKERLYGLNGNEGNHGEDVKEYYFYLDATPTHSYAKLLYKYPQREFPYQLLLDENARRGGSDPEYELLDTGVFEEDRYFDVLIEFAKTDAEEVCIRIEACNRGPEAAELHLLPQLIFRKRWGWSGDQDQLRPHIEPASTHGFACLAADDSASPPLSGLPFDYRLGPRFLYGPADAALLFTENETNAARVFGSEEMASGGFAKDAFHRHLIAGEDCLNPENSGTKAALHYRRVIEPGGSAVIELRLTDREYPKPLEGIAQTVAARRKDSDEFYQTVHQPGLNDAERNVQRQALAGLIWSKQIYLLDVHRWLRGDSAEWPPPESRWHIRNQHWLHLNSMRILTMPDKWEYPWFAAWDLAFQTVPFALVDPEFAKQQLAVILFEQFQHPNGQIPAYEWEFSDLNPPVHAWAVWRIYNMDRIRSGQADRDFLEKCFHKMLLNFTWWVNKVDAKGNNVFEGGFLGLDNITIVDRSAKLPDGATLQQSDATGWMGMFCLNMIRIALELARTNAVYEGLATKFFQHYVYIGAAMKNMGNRGYQLWDEKDGFFYDVLSYPDGRFQKLRLRSLVGLIPLLAIERLEEDWLQPFPEFRENLEWFLENRRDLVEQCVTTQIDEAGKKTHVLAVVSPEQMRKLLEYVWDPGEFRSDFGLRSLSKCHEQHPFRSGDAEVRYEPAESREKIKGGNSNWRGPVWLPMTFMMIETTRKLRKAYGKSFTVPSADADRPAVTLKEISQGFAERVVSAFLPDANQRRPIHGSRACFQHDPHWRDLVLFYEYLNGDTGEGLGASHQTGWTALVASLIDEWPAPVVEKL